MAETDAWVVLRVDSASTHFVLVILAVFQLKAHGRNTLQERVHPWFLRLIRCGFRWRRHSLFEAVGYEDASYGNSAEGE